jgi:Fe2+ or Zn2+ uptake regulation protein
MKKIEILKNNTKNNTMDLKMKNLRRAVHSKHLLHSEHLKSTKNRMFVLELFQQMRTTLCAENIQQALPQISSSSLYRILKTLEEKDLIKKSNPPDDYIIPRDKRDRTFYVLK